MSDPDDLRRRLYRPDASPEDVERYRAAAPPPEAPPAAARFRRTPPLVAGALLVGCALTAVAIGATVHPEATPTATATTRTAPAAPPGSTLTIPASDRAAFVRSLQAGRPSGLLAYLFTHPDARPPIISTVTRADSEEHAGEGATVISLDPVGVEAKGGRLTLVLTVDRPVTAGLTLDRVDASSPDGLAIKLELDPVRADAGLPAVVSLQYEGALNTVRLTVPPGVHWDLVADFTD